MAYSGCDGDNTNYKPNKSNSAKSRLANTSREVSFIAGAYYDYCKFAFNSGYCSDFSSVDRQFINMIQRFVANGKIKNESYNRFLKLFKSIGPKSIGSKTKEEFIDSITNALKNEENDKQSKMDTLDKLYGSLNDTLLNAGITLPKSKYDIVYVGLITMIVEANGYDESIVNKIASKLGLSGIKWETPKTLISSDGCSHNVYGSVLRHMNNVF